MPRRVSITNKIASLLVDEIGKSIKKQIKQPKSKKQPPKFKDDLPF